MRERPLYRWGVIGAPPREIRGPHGHRFHLLGIRYGRDAVYLKLACRFCFYRTQAVRPAYERHYWQGIAPRWRPRREAA